MFKKKEIYLIVIIILLQENTLSTNASIRPIITTNLPPTITIGLQEILLNWYVIDDNPDSYSILKNGSFLRDDVLITSNLINLSFSEVAGTYNLTLIVRDYSNFTAASTIIIHVQSIPATSTLTGTAASTTENSQRSSATPGYSLTDILFFIVIIGFFITFKRRKDKRRD